jgi:hypothetical protein
MNRLLALCALASLVLVVWVVADPTPSLDGTVLPPALLIAGVSLTAAAIAERRAR